MLVDKDYVEQGIQTSPPSSPVPPRTADQALTPKSNSVPTLLGSYPSSPSNITTRSPSSTRLDTAYSQSSYADSADFSPVCPRPAHRGLPKAQQLGFNRPSVPSKLLGRVISHSEPTARSSESLAALELSTPRVVSLPERPKPVALVDSPSPIRFRPVAPKRSYLCGDKEFYRTRGRTSIISDMPHTPSPPSSPESSVLIIGNDVHLPQTFLRYSPTLESQYQCSDDGDWLTWASSPPRPIPALHGPLSLPYARCPSGAEGTIIEGPDMLPGMIWGLGAEEDSSSRPSHNFQSTTPHGEFASGPPQPNIPPRLRKLAKSHQTYRTPLTEQPPLTSAAYASPALTRFDGRTQPASQYCEASVSQHYPHPRSGITLYNNLQVTNASPFDRAYGSAQAAHGHQKIESADTRARRNYGLGFDWQSALVQDNGRSYVTDVASLRQRNDQQHLSSSVYTPENRMSPDTYPGIIVEPRTPQLSNGLPPRRLSALEIAQHYHQQQLQNGLPTPPSPYWSTKSSSDCPIFLDVPYSGGRSSSVAYNLRPLGYSQALGHVVGDSREEALDLFPQAPIDIYTPAQVQRIPKTRVLPKYHQPSNVSSSPFLSPAFPGPPPNTPLPPTPGNSNYRPPFSLTNPPSPLSPEPRARILSHQQPRSIPLARLIQRRLSSVPEEDPNVSADKANLPCGPSPAPKSVGIPSRVFPGPSRASGRAGSTNHSVSHPHSSDLNAPSVLSSATGESDPGFFASSDAVEVNVRLPPKPLMANSSVKGLDVSDRGGIAIETASVKGSAPAARRARTPRRKKAKKFKSTLATTPASVITAT